MFENQGKAAGDAATGGGATPGVSIRAVSKSFGETKVIDDVSLEIGAGEFVVFLGPSGCGKSTILRMIAGLETVDEGEIHIGETRVDPLPPGKRDVAMVFQNYALYPHMTVRDNLAFGLNNARLPQDEIASRIDAAVKSLEIESYLERKPGQLSGGQRQRVAIARAIVKKPRLFLFDEPLSNLDAALRTRTRIELAQLHRRLGVTMIFVTHDQIEAMTLADKIVLLNNKKIEQIATPMEIYHRPATAFAASFVGAPKINLLDVTVSQGEDGYAVAYLANGYAVQTRIPMQTLPASLSSVQLGARPEAVFRAGADESGVVCEIQVVEKLGDRAFLYGALEGAGDIIAETDGLTPVKAGDRIALRIDGAAAHLFDESGRAYHAEPQS